jgi:hypothetical protein
MDVYHIWCDLKPGVSDVAFADKVAAYFGHLKAQGLIEGWRVTRRKLGLAPAGFGDFHLIVETKGMAQLDAAFTHVASRRSPVEDFHVHVNALVANAQFALYRDFPDPVRHRGEEKF